MAKQVSTAAVLSGDRVGFGVGVGWCKEEFAATGQDFHTRGRRLDEMLPRLRELWSGAQVELPGLPPLSMSPVPAAPIPIYVGGDSEAALRRAARAGDGWIGNRIYTEEQIDVVLADLRRYLKEYGRPEDALEIVAPLAVLPDAATYRRFADKGITATMAAPWWLSPGEPKVATMERFAEEVISKM
ncbi:LLM class flavin-dependent oxidoreductase [Nonomuraea dietziae]|uniref:LLM class flavin-dependent oxidoreductase n=1 Tax=Nonomuraea dietziae TaxID=65515 RepID=UPI003606D2DB